MDRCGVKIMWLLILLMLTAVLASALFSGNILLYIAPRMVPMAWFGAAVLTGLCVYEGYETIRYLRIKEATGNVKLGMLLFFVPIIVLFTAMPNASTPGSLPNQNVSIFSLTSVSAAGVSEQKALQESETDNTVENELSAFLPCVLEEERAYFNSAADIFRDYLYETADALDGRTITVYGIVYYDESFQENTVLVSRLMMNCCAADAATVGFHVKIEDAADLQLNEWIRVTGTVRTMKMLYYGTYYDFPVLTDGLVLRCDAPDIEDAYIYP